MKTVATKQPTRESVKPKKSGVRLSRSVSPLSPGMPLLQRQCACGGGCPRCQEDLGIQTKLKIGKPGDKYEQEADRIADKIMGMPKQHLPQQQGLTRPTVKGKIAGLLLQRQSEENITPATDPLSAREFRRNCYSECLRTTRVPCGSEPSTVDEIRERCGQTNTLSTWVDLRGGSRPPGDPLDCILFSLERIQHEEVLPEACQDWPHHWECKRRCDDWRLW